LHRVIELYTWPLFGWLDDVDVDVQVDLGHVLTLPTPGIHLVGRGQHVDIGGFCVSIWSTLTSLQREGRTWYGSGHLQSSDPAHLVNGID